MKRPDTFAQLVSNPATDYGIKDHVCIAERVLGHALSGLHGVYDQGRHRTQKRAALERWEAKLLSIVGQKSLVANVSRPIIGGRRSVPGTRHVT
jgi:hypothetical protein